MAQQFIFEKQLTQDPIQVKGPNGELIDAILGQYRVEKTYNGETKVTRFVTVGNTPDEVFKDSNVRLYIPLRGSYDPSDEELIKLFTGEVVHLDDLKKKDGNTYSGDFEFDLWAERSFENRFGKTVSPNFTGELKFAKRPKKDDDLW